MRKCISKSGVATGLAAVGLAASLLMAPAAAAGPIGPTRASGYLTCPAGQAVYIESYASGLITHGWTTGGGPNPVYDSVEYFQGWFGINYTNSGAQNVTWYIQVDPHPGGEDTAYGMGDGANGAFCG